jgi:glycyl-tRNA synthetase beta chain
VEWPVVYRGTFEDRYLEVPQECLVLTMQQNQRYFALTDEQGRIQSQFLVVSNIETLDPSAIIGGNERVLRARLSDAKFFFDQDRKRTMESRISGLDKIVYHQRLGSMGDRTRRIAQIARAIATDVQCDPVTIERAAVLCKADLVTEMVGEFPELQGIMGRYYALHDGESPAVAQAIEEHYRPRFAKDDVPESKAGQCLALADKLESIVGLFAVGSAPTGDRDPYALRRQALAVLRILSEKALAIRLDRLLELASAAFAGSADPHPVLASVTEFFYERLRSLLKDQGFTPAEIEAVVSLAPERIDLVVEQVKAVRSFAQMPEAASLSAANKRIGNILKKAGSITAEYQVALLTEPAEKALAAELSELEPGVLTFYKAQGYAAGLASLAGLRAPVDAFFEEVMVMADDEVLKNNRIALLGRLYRLMNQFADLSKLASA